MNHIGNAKSDHLQYIDQDALRALLIQPSDSQQSSGTHLKGTRNGDSHKNCKESQQA